MLEVWPVPPLEYEPTGHGMNSAAFVVQYPPSGQGTPVVLADPMLHRDPEMQLTGATLTSLLVHACPIGHGIQRSMDHIATRG